MKLLTDFDVTRFSGTAPIFPLPSTVLYPHMSLPLHIFEPRYRALLADALDGERVIAMALLQNPLSGPSWSKQENPQIHEMTCLGKIVAHEMLPDGRSNIVLQGLYRAVVVEELSLDEPYRMAQLELYKDLYPSEPVIDRDHRRRELLLGFRKLLKHADAESVVGQLFESAIPLGTLSDVIANILRIDHSARQEMLEEVDADQRSELLLMHLRRECAAAGLENCTVFPPRFSLN